MVVCFLWVAVLALFVIVVIEVLWGFGLIASMFCCLVGFVN